jgi:predicted MFS family arabinose efflux permease
MQWLHASYGVGITAGPLIMTAALTNFQNWRLGYLLVGTVQIVLAITFWITLPIWQQNNNAPAESPVEPQKEVNLRQTLKRRRVWLSMLLFFFYVGSEVTMGTGFTPCSPKGENRSTVSGVFCRQLLVHLYHRAHLSRFSNA